MHAKFALDVYDKLDINTKYLLLDYKNYLTTFAQSVDPLFLYDLKHKNSRIRDFCHYFHNNKSKDFFKNLINYIKYNHLENDPEIIAFLYGFLSHYILDSTMHPYIIYKTGIFNKNDKDTYKYNLAKVESNIVSGRQTLLKKYTLYKNIESLFFMLFIFNSCSNI